MGFWLHSLKWGLDISPVLPDHSTQMRLKTPFHGRGLRIPGGLTLAFVFLSAAGGQPAADVRKAELIARGLALMEQGNYREAANLLEEAWERDSSDAALAENLAICLLHGRRAHEGAYRLMKEALALGGKASILVDHIHENAFLAAGIANDTCKGRLSLQKGRLSFVSSLPEHSFSMLTSEVKSMKRNRLLGAERGAFHIESARGKKTNFSPADWQQKTTEIIFRIWESGR